MKKRPTWVFVCSSGGRTASPLVMEVLLRVRLWSLLAWMEDRQTHMLSSCDQAAVDAARPQSPLQSALLLLGSQDCNDGLVEHRLQALLGQSGTFHVATGTDLRREQKDCE